MEALKLPMREIRKKYTKSEMTIMAWRSAEMAANMKRHSAQAPGPVPANIKDQLQFNPDMIPGRITDELERYLEEKLGPVALKLEDDGHGSYDMRKLTGEEAAHFLATMGMPMPVGLGRGTNNG